MALPPEALLHPQGGRPFHYADGRLFCDGVDVSALAARYGTPLYCYSADGIAQRFSMLRDAFANRAATVCYAVKANSSLAILRLLADLGAGFDIVSGGELARVQAAAPQAVERIVFSGVGKTSPEMDAALDAGILLFNVESEGELLLLAARAARKRKIARFALRVNPDVFTETHPYISTGLREHKFGLPVREARRLYQSFARHRWLQPAGISVHIGSQIRDISTFRTAVARVVALVAELRGDRLPIAYLDAGGGLGIEYRAGRPFDAPAVAAKYASGIMKAAGDQPLHLLLEPGRFLVAHAGALLTRVLYVKRNGRKKFVITDAGMNDLIRPALYGATHAIVPVVEPSGGRRQTVDVVGPVCETGDFFARDLRLPEAAPSDLLAILDAGAYGMSLSSNYNSRPPAAEVLVEGRKARLVRRRVSADDLFRDEIL